MIKKLKAWFQLFRPPNLFTVPGDPILGYLIGAGTLAAIDFSLVLVTLSALCLYAYGLLSNDLADLAEDRLKRPDRPLPSGLVSPSAAKFAAFLLLAAGLILAFNINKNAFYIAFFLAVFIFLYNNFFKKNSVLGPFTVALCRAFSVILGYSAAFKSHRIDSMLYIVAFTWLLYFFAVSLAAYYETEQDKQVRGTFMMFMVPILWMVTAPVGSGALTPILFMKEMNPSFFLALAATTIFAMFIVKNGIIMGLKKEKPGVIPKCIGELIWNVLFLQAAGCAFIGFPHFALGIFVLAIPARMMAKVFYAS